MEETPAGTSVGVDDPYDHAGRCDHLTGDGRCRLALDGAADPAFVAARRAEGYACVAADGAFRDCPRYRSTTDGRECARCGLAEVRMAHDDDRPLVEEHHLSYPDRGASPEITVALCRWCHARVHRSWARVDDDADPVPEAVAAREARRSRELGEAAFETAAERRERRDTND
ncbi:MAG: hypothetical protein ABEJ81_08785 [Haloferacaceae archaeon]